MHMTKKESPRKVESALMICLMLAILQGTLSIAWLLSVSGE